MISFDIKYRNYDSLQPRHCYASFLAACPTKCFLSIVFTILIIHSLIIYIINKNKIEEVN